MRYYIMFGYEKSASPPLRLIIYFFGGYLSMFDQISDIIAKQLRAENDEITEETNIMEDLGADSLDIVEILMAIEETFGVSISDDEIPNLKTVRDLVEYVESNM